MPQQKKGKKSKIILLSKVKQLYLSRFHYTYRGEKGEVVPKSTTKVKFSSNVDSIEKNSFRRCDSLRGIIIPPSIESIGRNAFDRCESLTSVEISSTLRVIGKGAFAGCTSLETIDVPSSVERIGENAFYECKSLMQINLPPSIQTIGQFVFTGCANLRSIEIPCNVKCIRKCAFAGCKSLSNVTLPPSLQCIDALAFSGCASIATIDFPPSLQYIGHRAFAECTSLEKVYINQNTYLDDSVFPEFTTVIRSSWYEVGTCILLRELFMGERAAAKQLSEEGSQKELQVIQMFLTSANNDIFRSTLDFLVYKKKDVV